MSAPPRRGSRRLNCPPTIRPRCEHSGRVTARYSDAARTQPDRRYWHERPLARPSNASPPLAAPRPHPAPAHGSLTSRYTLAAPARRIHSRWRSVARSSVTARRLTLSIRRSCRSRRRPGLDARRGAQQVREHCPRRGRVTRRSRPGDRPRTAGRSSLAAARARRTHGPGTAVRGRRLRSRSCGTDRAVRSAAGRAPAAPRWRSVGCAAAPRRSGRQLRLTIGRARRAAHVEILGLELVQIIRDRRRSSVRDGCCPRAYPPGAPAARTGSSVSTATLVARRQAAARSRPRSTRARLEVEHAAFDVAANRMALRAA